MRKVFILVFVICFLLFSCNQSFNDSFSSTSIRFDLSQIEDILGSYINESNDALNRTVLGNNKARLEVSCKTDTYYKHINQDIESLGPINIEFSNTPIAKEITISADLIVSDGDKDISLYKGSSLFTSQVGENQISLTMKRASYLITFNANNGDGTMNGQFVEKGISTALSTNTFNRPGYIFMGWAATSDATEAIYKDGEALKIEDSDITLYAVWKAESSTLAFDANGGEGVMEPQVFCLGIEQKLNKNTFSRVGYNFIGWTTTLVSMDDIINDEAEYIITTENDITLYAVWEIITYSITFDLNGGTGILPDALSKDYGETIRIQLPSNTDYVREGYLFKGWGLAKDSTDLLSSNGFDYEVNADLVIYAVWQKEYQIDATLPADTELTVTKDATSGAYIITAAEGFEEYRWFIDGEGIDAIDTTVNSLEYTFAPGFYTIMVLMQTSNGIYYSSQCEITVTE